MLVKTGEAEIIDVVSTEEIQDDDKRKDALAKALEKAKIRISAKDKIHPKTDKTTEN